MTTAALRLIAGVFLAAFVTVGLARADPLLVREGSFGYDGDTAGFSWAGTGFSMHGGGTGIPLQSHFYPCAGFCPPGTAVDLSSIAGGAFSPGALGLGSATIDGITLNADQGTSIWFGGTLVFTAPTIITPPLANVPSGDEVLFLTAPFSLAGRLAGFRSEAGGLLFDEGVTGQGTVRVATMISPDMGYHFSFVRYDFTATPEPATLLLLGLGGGALFARRRTVKVKTMPPLTTPAREPR